MSKLNKILAVGLFVLVVGIVCLTMGFANCANHNAKLRYKLQVYMSYYSNAEILFDEIADHNKAAFDTDKAEDYIQAKKNVEDVDSLWVNHVNEYIERFANNSHSN